MPLSSPYRIELTSDERAALVVLIRPTGQARMLLRARIVLAAADGHSNAGIARDVGVCQDTVRKWRRRYAAERLAGLADAHRSGRPIRFAPVQRAQVIALACELPASRGMPLSRWSSFELACEAIEAGIVADISPSTVARWLARDAIKPWQYRSWIAPRAPDFATRATVVLDLYARVWNGQPLGPGDYVLCSDEKTSIQARCRCHPTLPPGTARTMRVEHEYQRGGALAYLAAWDVHCGRVFDRCETTTGVAPCGRLVEQVMSIEPYASANRVFWVVDNGSSHRGQAAVDRMNKAWPTAPASAHACACQLAQPVRDLLLRRATQSRHTQRLLRPRRRRSRLMAFQDLYNAAARPFNWKYTTNDLNALLAHHRSRTQLTPGTGRVTPDELTPKTT